jgi:hypothetical protein
MSVLEILAAAAGCAALFALFVAVNPARGCSGDCGQCTGTCSSHGGKS